MKKHSKVIGLLVMLSLTGCERAEQAQENTSESAGAEKAAPASRGTLGEARAMLDRAEEHYNTVGRDQALQDFTARTPRFSDRDLYVFCFGPDALTSAHGADAALIGKPVGELRDLDDQPFATRMVEISQQQPGRGEITYKWNNPVSGVVERKVSVFRKVGEDVCGVGAYHSDAEPGH